MWHRWLVGSFILLAPTQLDTAVWSKGVVKRPSRSYRLPLWRQLAKPIGPAASRRYLRLVRLNNGQSIPEIAAAESCQAIPPSYFDPRSDCLIGFAACGGQLVPSIALSTKATDRVLVVTRRQVWLSRQNAWYIDPIKLYRRVGRRPIDRGLIRQLGLDLQRFDVVTMHLNRCVVPDTYRPRSGLIATSSEVKLFSWPTRLGTLHSVRRYRPTGGTLLFGDGGRTISHPEERDSKVALLLCRLK